MGKSMSKPASKRIYWIAVTCSIIVTSILVYVAWVLLPQDHFLLVVIAGAVIGGSALDIFVSRQNSKESDN